MRLQMHSDCISTRAVRRAYLVSEFAMRRLWQTIAARVGALALVSLVVAMLGLAGHQHPDDASVESSTCAACVVAGHAVAEAPLPPSALPVAFASTPLAPAVVACRAGRAVRAARGRAPPVLPLTVPL